MRCGIYLTAQNEKAMWEELLHALSCPGALWQVDELMIEGPLDDGLYAPDALTDALTACSYLQEARALLLPEGTAFPDNLPDWEGFRQSPIIAAIYFMDCREFEIFTQDPALLSRLAHLEGSPQVATFEWIDDGDVGRTYF